MVRAARAAGNKTPALFLSTMGGIDDRVTELDAGGDDYLVKPFAFAELLARVNALGRRPALTEVVTQLRVGDLQMDLFKRGSLGRDARSISSIGSSGCWNT
jgi:two-component system OmpR family response regulator